MLHEHMIRTALDEMDGVFHLYQEGRISPLILGVNLRRHADDLSVFDPEASADLSRLADEVDALPDTGDRKAALRGVYNQFLAYRKQVLQRLKEREGEQQTQTDAARQAAAQDQQEKIALVRAAEDAVRQRSQAAIDAVKAAKPAAPATPAAPAAPAAPDAPAPAASGDDAAMKAALAEVADLEGDDPPPAGDDVKNMTVDDIEKILNETKRKL